MLKIAFVINFSKNSWAGGYLFFDNLISFLIKYKKNVKISVITDSKKNLKYLTSKSKVQILETNIVSHKINLKRIIDKVLIIIFGKSFFLEKFLINNKIDVLSHHTYCGRKSIIRSYPWFPDFQHLRFPKNFSFKNRLFRNLNVYLSSKHSNKIILSSKDVKKDIKKISPEAFRKSYIINHTNKVVSQKKLLSITKLRKKYNISKNFFLLPNHYWVHKNHIIVLKALNYLSDKNIQVVSTGMLSDHRNRNYIDKIRNYINFNNLNQNYKILDLVPFEDLCSLMKNSLAVINPSFSEGWGNSADQARILGKPCILSNIPVHLELNYKYAHYFNPNDYKELAKLLNFLIKKKIKISFKDNSFKEKEYINNYLKTILD